jgi:hypothetical protein
MNQTELFQFDFKTVGYGSIIFGLVRFSLAVWFEFLVFFCQALCVTNKSAKAWI